MPNTIGKGVVEVVYDKAQAESAAHDAILPGIESAAKTAAGIFAAVKIFDFAKQGFEEMAAAEKVSAQTAVTLKNLGDTAGVTAEDVDGLAKSMLEQSGVDDEVAKSAENVLLRLGVTGEAFRRATQDSNDLAVAMGTDMTSAAELLGKALAHPEQAAKLLKPAIGGLTAAQLDSIKAFVAQGDIAGAQGVIFDALEAKVAGSAAAYGQTLPGQLAIAKESLNNLKGELVEGAAPAVELFASASKSAVDAISGLPDPVKDVIGGIGALAFVVGGVVQPLAGVSNILSLLATKRAEHAAAATGETGVLAANAAAASVDAVATVELAGAEDLVATNSAAAVAGLYEVTAAEEAASVGALGTAAAIGGLVVLAGAGIEGIAQTFHLFGQEGEHLSVSMQGAVPSIKDFSDNLAGIKGVTDLTGKSLADVAAGIAEKSIPAARNFNEALRIQGTSTDEVTAAIDRVEAAQHAAEAGAKGMTVAEYDQAAALDAAAKASEGFSGFLDELTGAMSKSYEASGRLNGITITNKDLIVDYEGNVDDLTDKLKKNTLTTDLHTEAGRTNYEQLKKTGESIVALIENHVQEGASLDEAIGWGNQYVDNLKDQLREAGYNEQQISDMIDEINLTPENIKTEFSNNAPLAQLVVEKYIQQLDGIPPEIQSQIEAEINAGQYDLVNAQLGELAKDRIVTFVPNYDYVQNLGDPRYRQRAAGGPVDPNEMFRGGEQGFEILWKDSMYQAPPGGGWVMPHAQSEAFMQGGMNGGDVNIYVTAAPGATYEQGRAFGRGIKAEVARV